MIITAGVENWVPTLNSNKFDTSPRHQPLTLLKPTAFSTLVAYSGTARYLPLRSNDSRLPSDFKYHHTLVGLSVVGFYVGDFDAGGKLSIYINTVVE